MQNDDLLIIPEKLRRLRSRLEARLDRRDRAKKLIRPKGKKEWWKRLVP